MKTLLTYVLVASMGLVTTYSFAKAQEERVDYVASLKSLPLQNNDFAAVKNHVESTIQAIPQYRFKKKQSFIYYINTTEAIDIAMGQKDYSRIRAFDLRMPLNPDKAKLHRLLHRDTNFRKALLINVKETKVTTTGEFQLSPNAKASIKLPFIKQEIGEYLHQRMYGTFAVFR
ncbi:MAG: hypothetical protein HEP71_05325 [Roseivirga sp.]|nr:hypothetical protein [Roseivirga sp.]